MSLWIVKELNLNVQIKNGSTTMKQRVKLKLGLLKLRALKNEGRPYVISLLCHNLRMFIQNLYELLISFLCYSSVEEVTSGTWIQIPYYHHNSATKQMLKWIPFLLWSPKRKYREKRGIMGCFKQEITTRAPFLMF